MDPKEKKKTVMADIYVHLPGRDCGITHPPSPCGLDKCMLFAGALLDGFKKVHDCPYMNKEQRGQIVLILDEFFS